MSRLQPSGPISISDINVELRRAWNAPFSWNDGQTLQLAQYRGGELPISQFYGKQLYPDAGTPLGDYCYGYTLFRRYADGNGGFNSAPIEDPSPSCGWVPPPPIVPACPPYGQITEQFCIGTTLYTNMTDGNCGIIQVGEGNHPACVGQGGGGGGG
jgi:hypothetical protein